MTSLADQDRFLVLIEDHKKILYKVAHAYCKNEHDRPDLIQEIVIQLWQSFGRFDGRSQFSTWMYRIAMNVAISFYRTGSRRIQAAASLDELELEIAVADQMLEGAGDDLRLLYQMINRLDELNRALIILCLDGYDHATIAEIVGITPTNVATRLNRIKQKLQRDFDAMQKE